MSVFFEESGKRLSKTGFFALLWGLSLFFLTACAFAPQSQREKDDDQGKNDPWLILARRLEADNVATPFLAEYFRSLPPYSGVPMSVKMKELFWIAYPPPAQKPSAVVESEIPLKARIYKSSVTRQSMALCSDYLLEHDEAFRLMEKKHGVPKEIVVALLYVETRLGTYVGKDNALWILASMAAADRPEVVRAYLADLPLGPEHEAWLRGKLRERSQWAYKELKALLSYVSENNLNPALIPGSMYGAIGFCQFMPSNIPLFAEDADQDGCIDLFSHADAIHSVANYLRQNGWKSGMTVDGQRRALKRYNNLTVYANTILTLAASVRSGVLYAAPPDMVAKGAQVKKGLQKKTVPPVLKKAPKGAVVKARQSASSAGEKKAAQSPQRKKNVQN